ncbi:hypothetical protein H920_03385 [Fukomys damarensis]|uniref:Uncharacterized protein n=1 Tax=Fukomys damarensis TaxID=885580 RepID=A0A091DYA9_FUKDA|nr:hypothetical protein H920_03385 [Fukomys damarensis]
MVSKERKPDIKGLRTSRARTVCDHGSSAALDPVAESWEILVLLETRQAQFPLAQSILGYGQGHVSSVLSILPNLRQKEKPGPLDTPTNVFSAIVSSPLA